MYRLLRVGGVPLQGAWTSSSLQTCLSCSLYRRSTPLRSLDHLQSIRYRSSTINNVMLSSIGKKKMKRKTKKYAELLEVKDSVTSNTKAAVQKLNSAQLSILVDQPDITLDKLHQINSKYMPKKSNSHKKPQVRCFSSGTETMDQSSASAGANFPQFPDVFSADGISHEDAEFSVEDFKISNSINDHLLIKSDISLDDPYESIEEANLNKQLEPERIEEPNNLEESEATISDKEQEAREAVIHEEKVKQYNLSMKSYLSVCVNSDYYLDIYNLLKWRPNPKHPKRVYVDDVSVYNVYIENLASKGALKDILRVLANLKGSKINLNLQTYSYIFECIGRMNESDHKKLAILNQIMLEMKNDGISLNDVITKSTFIRDQRIFVENTVKLLDKDFQPVYEMPDVNYDCRLLEKLSKEPAQPSSTVESLLSIDDFESRLKKQMKMEIEGQVTVCNIAKKHTSQENVNFWRNKLSSTESKWEKIALHSFKINLATLKNEEGLKRHMRSLYLYPYLSLLRPAEYIGILMKEVQRIGMGSEMYSIPYNSLCRNVGAKVFKMYEAQKKEANGVNDKTAQVYIQYCDWFVKRDDKVNSRIKWTQLEHEANKDGVTLNAETPAWQANINWQIGKFLYNIITEDLKIEMHYTGKKKNNHPHHFHKVPAFFKVYRHNGVKLVYEIKPHPMVAKLYRDSSPETLTFDTTLVPSVCPPRPWTSIHQGGYIVTKTDIVRIAHMGNQQWDRLLSAPPQKLYPALDSLNQLGSIPWTVNSSVLDVAIKVFQNDGSVELNMPQPPSVLKPIPPTPKDMDPEEKKKIEKARMDLKRKKHNMYSLWCDALYRLSLANHFRDDIFWLPHNMDFRGRVYPIPPHLNHLGSDLARSMLVFALKKPLGPKGLDWLKLHCINLTGFKKRDPVSERLKYANENMDKILDSAENPLTGKMWWSTSDEPWQTLSACMEIAAALKSPNPEEFMSGFPIHQDGSCNGLQHYAALGRDQIGAESVNLYPSDVPQDVYSSVAAMVDEIRQEDANNPSSRDHQIAQVLEGFIKRKVIKQTVMTTVYGVTRFGARLQIARQLKDLDDFPEEHVWNGSAYLTKKTFQTLRTMFKSAREIQDWFTECARLICHMRVENMEWVTPLGLPVIQPYSKVNWTLSNKDNISPLFTPDVYRKPNIMKQRNAFAPNFVHSLDSSHMMLTSIYTEHAGITFVSVHDCYWTHPSTVEIMNKICRKQFVALHSEPILDDLSKFLVEKFGYPEVDSGEQGTSIVVDSKKQNLIDCKKKLNDTLRKVPNQGDFDLNKVLSSLYFFS